MGGLLGSLCFFPALHSTAPMTLSKGYPLSWPPSSRLQIVSAGPIISQRHHSTETPQELWSPGKDGKTSSVSGQSTPWPGPAEPTRM